ncbi:MAG: DUF3488 domain-containing protein [Bacteriovorax sp.]|nr:DUF3488 domain-containing protein [Bacteriovorax sp.]
MKVDIKKLSIFLVVFNALMMFKDLPMSILGSVLLIIFLSFIVTHKTLRSFFKIFILIASIILLKFLFKTYLLTEAGVSLVMILSALKLWEMDTESDHFNMFLILALLECCLFLLNPTFIAFFLGIIKIFIFFYFLLKIRNYDLTLLSGKRLLFLVVPSLFLSLILFYTFPRFTQGFLSTTNNQLLFSGADSQLSFKKLGPLNLSSKIVFRVYGLNAHKFPFHLLYWRQSVLWDFNKEEWRTGYLHFKSEQLTSPGPVVNYNIQLVQDYNEFLPVLDGVTRLIKSNLTYNFYTEHSFRLKNISRTSVKYNAITSFKEIPQILTPLMERKGLRLKSEQKEKIKELILKNKMDKSNLSDNEKFEMAIDFFKKRNYEYSLTPPAYSSLEDFILTGKAGYCSHFAAAFAYITRAIGLPSRIISGFQGGEFNPYDQSLIVREMDGHMWVEVYLKNIGWYKFDPTATVAPGRINLGAKSFHDKVEPFINLYYYQLPKSVLEFASFNHFSLWLDSLSSRFDTSLINFDKDKQQQILNSFIPKSISLGWLFSIALSGSMPLFWFFFSWLNKKKSNPNEKRYKKFIARLKKEGVEKLPHESVSSFRKRCLLKTNSLEDYINTETNHYIKYYYERSSDFKC